MFAVSTLLDVAHRGAEVLGDFLTKGLGPPPEWLGRIPAVGNQLVAKWQEIAAGGRDALIETARPYVGAATHWLVAVTGGIGVVAVNILLTVALVAILFVQGETAARGALDNVLRPILIRRGVQLPMLLIIAGVIGGLIAFGVMGLFVGPVILAASYTLVKSWVAEGGPPPLQATTAPAATTTTTTTTP
jgi:predicted PurR-regulated permease PerM